MVEDLTAKPNHVLNQIVHVLHDALSQSLDIEIRRTSPIVSVSDNYDKLYYPTEAVARDSRYTRWIDKDLILRTQMTSSIPAWLADKPINKAVLCPGLVYRRDVVDRYHVGEPHQMDIWWVTDNKVGRKELLDLIDTVITTVIGDVKYRCNETNHHYTKDGLEVEIWWNDEWVEVLECGEILPQLLTDHDIENCSGLAMGIGLDRIAMLLKGIPDIRLLRATDERISSQMTTLDKWVPVSNAPPISRDLSVALNSDLDEEEIGDLVRMSTPYLDWIEEITIKDIHGWDTLPQVARDRLGMTNTQNNVLLNVVMRHPSETLSKQLVKEIMTDLYRALHQGKKGYL